MGDSMDVESIALLSAALGVLSTVAFLVLLVWLVRSVRQVRNQLTGPVRGETLDSDSDKGDG